MSIIAILRFRKQTYRSTKAPAHNGRITCSEGGDFRQGCKENEGIGLR